MKDLSFKNDFDFHQDKVMQTKDMTTIHRQKSLTLVDKKENKNFPRFVFFKISQKGFAAHSPAPAHELTPSQAKELQ